MHSVMAGRTFHESPVTAIETSRQNNASARPAAAVGEAGPLVRAATLALLAGLCALAFIGDFSLRYTPLVWTERTDFAPALPPSIRVFEGRAAYEDGSPLRAWYVDVDYNDEQLMARPFLSDAPAGKEAASGMARKAGAFVAINGGYFDMTGIPARTFSLVKSGGRTLVPNTLLVTRPGQKYFVTRSALGVRKDRSFDVAWIAHFGEAIYAYPEPTRNTRGIAAPPPAPDYPAGGAVWNAEEAIGGGPTLLHEGRIVNTYENEVFFGSGFEGDRPYARAAAGYTANRHLILFATDGKQALHSIGLTLPHLAEEMQRLGCVEAMNLDGGGSETLVVNGAAINHPSDGRERDITSILAIVPAPPKAP